MLDLDKLLDDAIARTADGPKTELAQVYVGDDLLTIRVSELDGDSWAACTTAHLPRKGVSIDQSFSYNLTAASKDALPLSAVVVDGDEDQELTPEQWSKLWRATDPQGRQSITDAVFAVNEHAQLARLDAARKGIEAASRLKRRSPAS